MTWSVAAARVRPARSTEDLIGREDAVRASLGLLASARTLVLTGAGGIGKTRLAREVAARAADAAGLRVAFAALDGVRRGDAVAAAVLEAVGGPPPGARDALEVAAERFAA
ncbi:MAG: hypothetical protein HZB46_16155, partial [Solirubrobacterales bacterium]|nr:hypothetical protein [Solirubrobacterales bacterium]